MRYSTGILALGLIVTCVCMGAEIWLILRLLDIVPDSSADAQAVQDLASIGKWIAGATTATLVARWLLDRSARAGRIRLVRAVVLLAMWGAIATGVHHGLQYITDAIIDSLPDDARHDAVMIALYRKNVHDGRIGDLDFAPASGAALDDLQRVKAINAAIGLLDRERDYARRSEGVLLDAAEARKAAVVEQGQAQSDAFRQRIDQARAPFAALAEGAQDPTALLAFNGYRTLWRGVEMLQAQLAPTLSATAPAGAEGALARMLAAVPDENAPAAQLRDRIAAGAQTVLAPAAAELNLAALTLGDVPPDLDPRAFGRFIAETVAARRDDVLWHIEDRVLTALEAIDAAATHTPDTTVERQLVASVVVPPLALSFGMIGVIANLTATLLLAPALLLALVRAGSPRTVRLIRAASVAAPWAVVAAAIYLSPPVPPAEGQDFLRIAEEADAADELWVDLWVRMIGVEAALVGAQKSP